MMENKEIPPGIEEAERPTLQEHLTRLIVLISPASTTTWRPQIQKDRETEPSCREECRSRLWQPPLLGTTTQPGRYWSPSSGEPGRPSDWRDPSRPGLAWLYYSVTWPTLSITNKGDIILFMYDCVIYFIISSLGRDKKWWLNLFMNLFY